jgi:D-alanine transaminase
VAEPLPTCHLNGQLLPLREARVSPLDRGFLYADAVYEVVGVHGGRLTRLGAHLARLRRSLGEVDIVDPHTPQAWQSLLEELVAANGGGDLYVYLQVTRGAEFGRNHAPPPGLVPTVFAFCSPLPVDPPNLIEQGIACITAADTRWARCDIKSVALLANVLLRMRAASAGAGEAILLRDGWLTEATSAAVHVVIAGEIRTPPRSHALLPGTTRGLVEELAAAHGLGYRNAAVSEGELRSADEIWLSAATRGVLPVTQLDGLPVGPGRPGPIWHRMRALIAASCAAPPPAAG